MRSAAVLALLALAACGGDGDPVREAAEERLAEEFPEPDQPPVETLAGEWRVAGIDGRVLDGPDGLALSADENEIWWEPRCAGLVRQYRIDLHAIDIAPVPAAPPLASPDVALPDGSVPSPPPAVCTIGIPDALPMVTTALDAANTVIRTPENAVALSGGGHSLTLFAQ